MEDIIDINRKEDVAIEVNVVDDTTTTATVITEPDLIGSKGEDLELSIFSKWKRVIMGSCLLLLLVLPVIGGITFSYLMRKSQYDPADPYNVWPDSEYTGSKVVAMEAGVVDKGFSFSPNNHVLIKNGDDDYFVVNSPTNSRAPPMYMAVYMIENLFSNKESYGLHVVTKNSSENLSPYRDLYNYSDYRSLSQGLTQHSNSTSIDMIYLSSDSSDFVAARTLADALRYNVYGYNARARGPNMPGYDDAMESIALRIRNIAQNRESELYRLSNGPLASYAIPIRNTINLDNEYMDNIKNLRNEKRAAEELRLETLADEEEKSEGKAKRPVTRSGFKRIVIKSHTE